MLVRFSSPPLMKYNFGVLPILNDLFILEEMRKKSAATKLILHSGIDVACSMGSLPVVDNHSLEQPPNEIVNEKQSKENLIISTDSAGHMTLPDGTPVVQPADVTDANDHSLQFDLQDGLLPQKPFSNTFQIGSIDTVRCTSCSLRISPFLCTAHPHLSVILCKKCFKFYGKGEFAKDMDGKDENCRWCGDGGDLICCDSCSNTFCKSCIKRNLGRSFLQSIEDLPDDASWFCLMCNPSPLIPLQQECAKVFDRVKALNEQSRKRSEMKRNRSIATAPSKSTQNSVIRDTCRKPNEHRSPIATVVNMEFPEPRVTGSNKSELATAICNSADFYIKNSSIADILDQISSITSENFTEVVRSIRFCMESFLNDVRRSERNFIKAKTKEEIQSTVKVFQSIYRYHLLSRLSNVVSRVNGQIKANRSRKPESASIPGETIDLTGDIEIASSGTTGANCETLSADSLLKRRTSESASKNSISQGKRRKTLQVSENTQNGERSQATPANSAVVEKLVADAVEATKSIGEKNFVESPLPKPNLWDSLKENTQGTNP